VKATVPSFILPLPRHNTGIAEWKFFYLQYIVIRDGFQLTEWFGFWQGSDRVILVQNPDFSCAPIVALAADEQPRGK
jgi:hypothetical protein